MTQMLDWVKANQPVRFVDYMQQALYAPQGGYYTASTPKLGRQGDFITAPELTPLFGHTLANQCLQILTNLKQASILEFGAGTGRLCVDVLTALERDDALPANYYILEVSGSLKAKQQQTIQQALPHLIERVHWLSAWPETFTGVMLANEVIDAMPVHRFKYDQECLWESYIGVDEQGDLQETWQKMDNGKLRHYIEHVILPLNLPQPYYSEVNWLAKGWINQIGSCLNQGALIAIDYGFPRHEYYHPDRKTGTLMCHHQHHTHPDFLHKPGEQDITAHVDFTLIAESAYESGMHVAGFTNQAAFLMNNGLLSLNNSANDETALIQQSKAINYLTHPAEMGELFKVMALTKGMDISLTGFTLFDKRASL
ncbi:class I SAM-dependent methyltransferase [Legionella sp. W05-934-2]|uniref:class I SAM-dependent methyltransferase n=1 Tax=Legionella sp. W05-934-2 TaxID=1198649 RepID=UPI003461ADD8